MSSQPQEGHARHPTFMQYVVVAVFLFVITAIEFIIIFPEYRLGAATVPVLILLSAVKFAIVIMFYMHLKFDHKLFTWIFLGGLALGFTVGVSLLVLFASLGSTPQPRAYALDRAVPYEHEGAERSPEKESSEVSQPVETGEPPVEEPAPETGGGAEELVAQGQALFNGSCMACHTIEGISTGQVGPDLSHIGTDAAGRKPGVSASAYITESIREPEAFVAEGVERAIPGIMTAAITAGLSDDDVAALVEFLLAQK